MKKISFLAICLIVLSAITLAGCSGAEDTKNEGSYPEVVAWNYIIYGLSVETVPSDYIDTEIGQVERSIEPIPRRNGDSNTVSVGSKLYKIKDTSLMDAIAINMDGRFYKAYQSGILQ